MKNDKIGMWSDSLKFNEGEFSTLCINELQKSGTWEKFLADDKIKHSIETISTPNRSYDETRALKSALFEVRFAYLVYRSGLYAEYEVGLNANTDKTVDFKVFGESLDNKILLFELSSLRESNCQKNKTRLEIKNNQTDYECMLGGDDDVNEYCKAQNVLKEKAYKFPDEITENQFNIILLDMRSSILEFADDGDYKNILYGSKLSDGYTQRSMKDGKLFPGVFLQNTPHI